ncbi:YveK family protein [Pontibacter chinhatensis]|uniref:Chain length determinant protein n=1 Tax=Pontibacter chinhatensis TaxID=1436961 RepID=A0A1I2MYM9_9BACT|nr:chain length determinant protein [Pontibacter chinhatensis]SFF94221.1 Chain length determinant protein [Pontibacter chinhatensis]
MPHISEQENKPMRNSPDEIDLMVVFRYLGELIGKVQRGVNSVFRIIYKRFLLIFSLIAIGLGLAFALFSLAKPYYTSSMTLVLAEIRNQFVDNQLQRLSVMVGEGNYEAVAEDLDINIDAARQIKEMSFSNLDENRIAEDSVLTGSPFEIELSLYNNVLFPTMEVALANYLENNRYFSKQKSIKQREVESMINRLKGEIAALDSVKTSAATPRGPVNGFVYGEPLDPANLFKESITMYQKQVELEASLEQLDNIQIVNGFAPRLKPTGPKLSLYLLIGGGIAFIIGTIVAVNLEKRKNSVKV